MVAPMPDSLSFRPSIRAVANQPLQPPLACGLAGRGVDGQREHPRRAHGLRIGRGQELVQAPDLAGERVGRRLDRQLAHQLAQDRADGRAVGGRVGDRDLLDLQPVAVAGLEGEALDRPVEQAPGLVGASAHPQALGRGHADAVDQPAVDLEQVWRRRGGAGDEAERDGE